MKEKKTTIQNCIDYLDDMPQTPDIRLRKRILEALHSAEAAAKKVMQKIKDRKTKGR